jgi:predicted RNA binding protein YcfA (HicA-like mRNA interferase family)
LIHNGFELKRIKGSHRIYYNPFNKRRAVIPYHKKDIPIGTLLEIIKQAGINKDVL